MGQSKNKKFSAIKELIFIFIIVVGGGFILVNFYLLVNMLIEESIPVVIQRGSLPITNTSLYGSYYSKVVFLDKLDSILSIIPWVLLVVSIVYSISTFKKLKTNILTKILVCIRKLVLMIFLYEICNICIHAFALIITGIRFESCWCGSNYVRIIEKQN